MFKNLIPEIFYTHLQDGLEFFAGGLGFKILYEDADMAVIAPQVFRFKAGIS